MKLRKIYLSAVALSILTFVCLTGWGQSKKSANPGVSPPNSSAFGKTYAAWSAEHWKWLYSLPVTGHPLFQDGDVDLSVGQSGKVWFLGGTYTPSNVPNVGIANRTGTIPPGKALFFPIIDIEDSVLEHDPNGPVPTVAEMRAACAGLMDTVTDLKCEVDGVELKNLDLYRFQSPVFEYGPLPEDNILEYFQYPGPLEGKSSGPAVSDGYFVMLAPLSVGEHNIHFSAKMQGFALDIQYNLTVEP